MANEKRYIISTCVFSIGNTFYRVYSLGNVRACTRRHHEQQQHEKRIDSRRRFNRLVLSGGASDQTMEQVRNRVLDVIAENLALPMDEVTLTSTLTELGADSLDMLELQMALEEELKIKIPEDEEKLHTGNVNDIIMYICTRISCAE